MNIETGQHVVNMWSACVSTHEVYCTVYQKTNTKLLQIPAIPLLCSNCCWVMHYVLQCTAVRCCTRCVLLFALLCPLCAQHQCIAALSLGFFCLVSSIMHMLSHVTNTQGFFTEKRKKQTLITNACFIKQQQHRQAHDANSLMYMMNDKPLSQITRLFSCNRPAALFST